MSTYLAVRQAEMLERNLSKRDRRSSRALPRRIVIVPTRFISPEATLRAQYASRQRPISVLDEREALMQSGMTAKEANETILKGMRIQL